MLRRVVWYKFTDISEATALTMEAASTSETSMNFYQITRRNFPEDGHLKQKKKFRKELICLLSLHYLKMSIALKPAFAPP
jgi:hypothetical protein